MTRIQAWRPADGPVPPARFGLTPDQWRDMLALQRRYQDDPYLDWPEGYQHPYERQPRMRFAKWLKDTGRIRG